jgi:WXG100 family type VII secretion target
MMTETPFTVDPGAVQGASTSVQGTYTELEQLLAQIKPKIEALESGGLTGTGGQALQATFAKLMTEFNQLNSTLSTIGKNLGLTATGAADLQQQITNAFSSGQ